jgi:hypothetical protein
VSWLPECDSLKIGQHQQHRVSFSAFLLVYYTGESAILFHTCPAYTTALLGYCTCPAYTTARVLARHRWICNTIPHVSCIHYCSTARVLHTALYCVLHTALHAYWHDIGESAILFHAAALVSIAMIALVANPPISLCSSVLPFYISASSLSFSRERAYTRARAHTHRDFLSI